MQRLRQQLIALAFASALLGLTAPPAQAVCCGDGAIACGCISAAATAITGAIGAAASAWMTAWQTWALAPGPTGFHGAIGRLSAEIGRTSVTAVGIADAVNRQNVVNIQNTLKTQSPERYQPPPTACITATNAKRIGQTVAQSSGSTQSGAAASGRASRSGSAQSTSAAEVYNRHVGDLYCGPQDMEQKRCKGGIGKYPDADISAASLLYGAGPPASNGGVSMPPTRSFTPEQVQAAHDLIRNLVDALPDSQLRPEQENTPQAKAYAVILNARQARRSAVQLTLNGIVARREQNTQNSTDPRSVMDLLYSAVINDRIGNKDWVVVQNAASPEAVARESELILAYIAQMQYMLLERMDELLTIQAAQLTEQMNPITTEQVRRQREAAVTSGPGG